MSETFDYAPSIGGRPVNVAGAGGAVSKLEIFPSPARTGVPTVTQVGSTPNGDGSFRFTFDAPGQPNRYYAQVTWTASSTAAASIDKTIVLDLPTRYDLICSCEEVAIRLGVALPLTDAQRARIEQEIEGVQTDAANYINRPVFAVFDTVTDQSAVYGYAVTDYRAFPQLLDLYNDRVTILAATDNGAGGYTVSVMVGIDGRNEPALTRYVLAAAAEAIRNDPSAGMGKRQVTSVSAEGQSISYKQDSSSSASGADAPAGSLPTLSSLSSLKRLSVHQSPRQPGPPFPYGSGTRRYY